MPKGIPRNRYTLEFKQQVVETMQREKLRYHETEGRFWVVPRLITAWERIYLERRERGSKGRLRKGLNQKQRKIYWQRYSDCGQKMITCL